MQHAILFYFSGTGNTWWAARRLAALLSASGIATVALSIEGLGAREVSCLVQAADLVGLGYPIYGSDLPENMKEFTASLPAGRGQPSLVFCTQWLWSGDGARVGAEFLGNRGYAVEWGEHLFLPNNVCLPHFSWLPHTNDPRKLAPVWRRAEGRLRRLVGHIRAGRRFRRGFHWVGALSGSLQRVPFRASFASMRGSMGVDAQHCSGCGFCLRHCPVDNLVSEKGVITSRGVCILCLRCYNFCPELAMTYAGRRHQPHRAIPYRGPGGFAAWLEQRDEEPALAAWLSSAAGRTALPGKEGEGATR